MAVAKQLVVVGLAGLLMVAAGGVAAQAYPVKPLRMIVPFPPGGATDLMGRYLGLRLGEIFGQPFVIENRGGANGTLGLDAAAKAPPDGYTLVIGQTGNLTISVSLVKVGYDPVKDFSPLTLVVSSPHVIAVHPALPVRTFKELIALAKAKPAQRRNCENHEFAGCARPHGGSGGRHRDQQPGAVCGLRQNGNREMGAAHQGNRCEGGLNHL